MSFLARAGHVFKNEARLAIAALVALALGCGIGWLDCARAEDPGASVRLAAPGATSPPQASQTAGLAPEVATTVANLSSALDTAEKAVQQLSELEEGLARLRIEVEGILDQATATAEQLRPQLRAVKLQIDRLGPPPAKDGPEEAPPIAAERARLTAVAQNLDGAIKATEVSWVRARQLIERITVLRHSLFARNLLERLPSPLLPALWRAAVAAAPAVWARIGALGRDWWRWAMLEPLPLAAIAVGAPAAYLLLALLVRRARRRWRPLGGLAEPTLLERAVAAAWLAPLGVLPLAAVVLAVYGGLDGLDLLFPPWGQVAAALAKATLIMGTVGALLEAVLAPRAPPWRLVALNNRSVRRTGTIVRGIAAVYALDLALTEASHALFVPLAISIVQSFLATLAFALLLVALLLTPFESEGATPAPRPSRMTPYWLKVPVWLVIVFMVACTLPGYVALAGFAAQQLLSTGMVVVIGWLGYLAICAIIRGQQRSMDPLGRLLETRFGLDSPRRRQLAQLTEFALTFTLAVCALPLLMLEWGFSGADIRDGFKALFFGLEIGQFKISLARILFGIVLFLALVLATRLLQRFLRERALVTRLDPGIANSVETVVGYLGIALAALIALSYGGFDITSLAIVAGALSVGIGFGLQSIVNNFVSGLILLIERPIKVGDWIVLGDQQGNVRRISVRATEIETFDRASLIIPNSELITGRVLNWTHRNSLGRITLKVGVGYGADPEEVIAILEGCAKDHPQVLQTPEPRAVFEAFGASALDFSLRVHLADVSQALGIQSDLRIAILKALRTAKIDIPFQQLDVHVRAANGAGSYLESQEAEPRGLPLTGNGKRAGEGSA